MRKVTCRTHDLVLKHHSVDGGFELSVKDLLLESNSKKPLAIPFVGRSGAGKSTLLEALATMLKPYSGKISWDFKDDLHEHGFIWEWEKGKEIGKKVSKDEIARLRTSYFGFAFQDATLTSFLTVMDNLVYPQRLLGKSVNEAQSNAKKWLDMAFSNDTDDIDKILKKYPMQLSGGQRQRVSLVQAMCNEPFVLFADEPTGSLDGETRKEVMSVVTDIWQEEEGGMFIWVTHHKDERDEAKQYLFVSGSDGKSTSEYRTK